MNQAQLNSTPIYILVADIFGYSANKENQIAINKIREKLYEFGHKYFSNKENHFFKNTGDGFFASDIDAKEIAIKALKIKEEVRLMNKDYQYVAPLQVRMSLHVGEPQSIEISLNTIGTDIIKDLAGKPVIETARIEPIVKPDFIFCSDAFIQSLMQQNSELASTDLGIFAVGKEHDKKDFHLFALHQETEKSIYESAKQELINHITEKLGKKIEEVSKIMQDLESNGKIKEDTPPPYKNQSIFKLINASYNDENLQMFCNFNFEKVAENFGLTMSKNQKIMALMDYVKRQMQTGHLLGLIQEEFPQQYEQYKPYF